MNSQRQFVIVCGNINYDSVDGFLKDFFHPARDDSNCEVVFLNKTEPGLMFEGLLKRERTRVTYFKVIGQIQDQSLPLVYPNCIPGHNAQSSGLAKSGC